MIRTIVIGRLGQIQSNLAFQEMLRSVVGERGKWSAGGGERLAQRSRNGTSRRQATDGSRRSCGILRMLARDERADLRSGTGVVEGQ